MAATPAGQPVQQHRLHSLNPFKLDAGSQSVSHRQEENSGYGKVFDVQGSSPRDSLPGSCRHTSSYSRRGAWETGSRTRHVMNLLSRKVIPAMQEALPLTDGFKGGALRQLPEALCCKPLIKLFWRRGSTQQFEILVMRMSLGRSGI